MLYIVRVQQYCILKSRIESVRVVTKISLSYNIIYNYIYMYDSDITISYLWPVCNDIININNILLYSSYKTSSRSAHTTILYRAGEI